MVAAVLSRNMYFQVNCPIELRESGIFLDFRLNWLGHHGLFSEQSFNYFFFSSSHVVRVGVTMSNLGVAPFYYPLTLNVKAVDTTTGSSTLSKTISVPIANQLNNSSFVYCFNMAVQNNANIQFSIWLNSINLVGSQTIVFAISGTSASGVYSAPNSARWVLCNSEF